MVDGGLKSTGLLLAALVVERLLRNRSAAVRHSVLGAGLLGVPFIILGGAALRPASIWFEGLSEQLSLGLTAAYFVGVALMLVPLGRGLLALATLSRQASGDAPWLQSLRVRGGPRLGQANISVPMTFGWGRPVVLFPTSAEEWTDEERRSALAHELAHIRRGDWLLQMVSHVVVALTWFHPLTWVVRSRLLLQAEHAADDAVLAMGVRPSVYAEHLLARCSELAVLRPAAVAMSPRPGQLEQRVRAILAPSRSRRASRLATGLAVGAMALLALPLATASVVSEPAPHQPTCNPTPPMDIDSLRSLPGTAAALNFMLVEMQAIPTLELDARRDAAGHLVKNCPYRRGGVQLIATLRQELERLEQDGQEFVEHPAASEILHQLATLREAVDLHWGYMLALDVAALPMPGDDDYLGKRREAAALQTLESLSASSDPLAATSLSIEAVPNLTAEMDEPTGDRLNSAGRQLPHDKGLFFMKAATGAYQDELVQLDHLATELRLAARSSDQEDLPRALVDYAGQLELSAVRLSLLTQRLGRMGC